MRYNHFMGESMKERSEIEERYKWDLSSYIKDKDMLQEEFNYLENNFKHYKKFYKKFDNKETLLEYINFDNEFSLKYERLASYIYHRLDEDTSNTEFLSLMKRFDFLSNQIGEATSFVSPQMLSLENGYIQQIIADERFKDYKRYFSLILEEKKHKISEHDSKIFAKMSMFLGAPHDAYNALITGEIEFEDVKVDGKIYPVNEATYNKNLTNKNREVRRLSLSSLMNGYGKINKTLTSLYLNDVASDIFFAQHAKFKSVKEQALFGEEVTVEVYDKLIAQINKHIPVLHEMMEEKRKALKLDEIAYYDLFMPLTAEKSYSVEEGIELVKKATLPLGEEYNKIMCQKFEDKVIDYLPNKNKETGAYSSGCYGCPSIILMNYVDNLESVHTLAHEMGHAMHTELSNRTQHYANADYKIFVAEVASTVNEMLLYHSLVENADKDLKRALVFNVFNQFRTTVFRQTMFSEFEDWVHAQVENKVPLTYQDLNDYYFSLNKKYYGEKVALPEELKYEWSRIPHFYRPFYVYKYATGLISAVCITEKLREDKEYYKKYINFLKSGSIKGVLDLLKEIDVDLTTDQPYEIAFGMVERLLKELK